MVIGTAMLLVATVLLWVAVLLDLAPIVAGGAFALAGAGMGLGSTRTGVTMLAASTDRDRGFDSSALAIADSIGAALALSLCGIAYAAVGALGTASRTTAAADLARSLRMRFGGLVVLVHNEVPVRGLE
jgi:hypothetical protein